MYQLLAFPHSALAVKETAPTAEVEADSAHSMSSSILPELIDKIAEEFVASLSDFARENMAGRLKRGLALAKSGHVAVTGEPGIFRVTSSSGARVYTVDLNIRTCNCPDCRKGNICKHRIASYYIQQALFQSQPPTQIVEEPATEAVTVSQPPVREAVVWALAHIDDQTQVPVEIIETGDDTVLVRALPQVVDGELRPVFPFPSPFGSNVSWSSAELPRELISAIKVYRKEVKNG